MNLVTIHFRPEVQSAVAEALRASYPNYEQLIQTTSQIIASYLDDLEAAGQRAVEAEQRAETAREDADLYKKHADELLTVLKRAMEVFRHRRESLEEGIAMINKLPAMLPDMMDSYAAEAINVINSYKQARRAEERHKRDPKQAAKASAKEFWDAWQDDGSLYKGHADFARTMLDKFPILESQPVIERWCRRWKVEQAS